MRLWYFDCLAVIHGQVRTAPFTLSAVRPVLDARLEPGQKVNGSVLKELCQSGYMQHLRGQDLHVKGTHYVHQYRITDKGETAAARRAGAVATAAAG
jgi:hypothetical protein